MLMTRRPPEVGARRHTPRQRASAATLHTNKCKRSPKMLTHSRSTQLLGFTFCSESLPQGPREEPQGPRQEPQGPREETLEEMNQTSSCMKMVIGFWEPYLLILDTNPPYKVEGVAKDIIGIIMEKLNLCYELVKPDEEDFGFQLPNGTWNGALGFLNRSEADMSMAVFMMSASRGKAVDFSEPVYMEEQTLGFPRPKFGSDIAGIIKPFALDLPKTIEPFSLEIQASKDYSVTVVETYRTFFVFQMWVAIMLSLPVITSLMFLLNKANNYALSFARDAGVTTDDKGIAKPSIWSLCALLMQSVPWEPKDTSARTVSGMWLLTAFIIATVYRSNLVAMLVAPLLKLPFNSFEELAATHYKLYIAPGSRMYDAWKKAEPGSVLWSARNNFFSDVPYMVASRRYLNEEIGVCSTRITLEYGQHLAFSAKGYCGLYLIPRDRNIFKGTPVSFAFPKKSELKAKVDPIIRNLKESGITEYLLRNKMPNATECLKPLGSIKANSKRPLEVKDFYGALCVLFAGTALSTIVFICEIKKKKQRQQPKEENFLVVSVTKEDD
ncbi:ionotropic receptor 25a-like [Macrobrachium nipponense]|uniref:ionotropic receptor 25a-like n=1 Tax=Macrobrachium nipponense TaxID=159736 RepID=UPI0030C86C3D